MSQANPEIICNLTDQESRAHKETHRRALLPFLTETSYGAGTSRLSFSKPGATREILEQLIKFEQQCCAFLSLKLDEADTHFQLIVTGPEGSEDLVRNFFSVSPDADVSPQGGNCGCSSPSSPRKGNTRKYAVGFVTLCALGCAIPPALAAIGLIGVSTGVFIGKGIEAALITIAVLGLGYFVLKFVRKRQRDVSS